MTKLYSGPIDIQSMDQSGLRLYKQHISNDPIKTESMETVALFDRTWYEAVDLLLVAGVGGLLQGQQEAGRGH